MDLVDIIDNFHGKYSEFSNFHIYDVEFQGITYPSNEHAFVAAKSLDIEIRKVIKVAADKYGKPSPGKAKRMGRQLELRPDWEQVKLVIMYDLCKTKFAPGTKMAEKLLSTGDALLIEGNTWNDKVWGAVNGEGSNYLGKILMRVRAELRGERFDIY